MPESTPSTILFYFGIHVTKFYAENIELDTFINSLKSFGIANINKYKGNSNIKLKFQTKTDYV